MHGLGTRLGLVWLSHQPRALHHLHTDERVWCPSIEFFVAFPRNVKIKTHGYIIKCAKCEARLWHESFHESVFAMGMELTGSELFRSQFTPIVSRGHTLRFQQRVWGLGYIVIVDQYWTQCINFT